MKRGGHLTCHQPLSSLPTVPQRNGASCRGGGRRTKWGALETLPVTAFKLTGRDTRQSLKIQHSICLVSGFVNSYISIEKKFNRNRFK